MRLIFGLGNPGKSYENTRHNVGFSLIDFIAKKNNLTFKSDRKFNSLYSEYFVSGEKVLLIKPLSYMNLSGTVVKKYVQFYNVDIKSILIIQDDLDMKLGKIRVAFNSSSGGHNGIKSIIENLGTKEFLRLKIGISNNKEIDTKDFVLDNFSVEERLVLNNSYLKLENIVDDFIVMDINNLKCIYNGKN